MKKETVEIEYNRLSIQEKKMVIGTLNKLKHSYLVSGMDVDIPYFFWSTNPLLFKGIDPTDFLNINDSYEFGLQAVFYISVYLNNKRTS